MESLIGVLLYIGAISTNITYTDNQIYQIEDDNQQTVNQVEDTPSQMQAVEQVLEEHEILNVQGGDKVIIFVEELF